MCPKWDIMDMDAQPELSGFEAILQSYQSQHAGDATLYPDPSKLRQESATFSASLQHRKITSAEPYWYAVKRLSHLYESYLQDKGVTRTVKLGSCSEVAEAYFADGPGGVDAGTAVIWIYYNYFRELIQMHGKDPDVPTVCRSFFRGIEASSSPPRRLRLSVECEQQMRNAEPLEEVPLGQW